MTIPSLRQALSSGQPLYSSWLGFAGVAQASVITRSPFGAFTVDMQHGLMDFGEAVSLVQLALAQGKPPIARVPLEGWGIAGRFLDLSLIHI